MQLSVTALHTIAIVEKKKKVGKIPERDRNAYQISESDTQKDWRAPFIFFKILFF